MSKVACPGFAGWEGLPSVKLPSTRVEFSSVGVCRVKFTSLGAKFPSPGIQRVNFDLWGMSIVACPGYAGWEGLPGVTLPSPRVGFSSVSVLFFLFSTLSPLVLAIDCMNRDDWGRPLGPITPVT